MLRNFLKTAFRSLKRNKNYTILNVLGLGIGIGCSIVIYNIISYEMSFDKHQSNYENIYRIYREGVRNDGVYKDAGVPFTVSYALREDYPGIKTAMFSFLGDGLFVTSNSNGLIDKISLDRVACLQPEMLDMIDVNFLFGKEAVDLSDKKTITLSVTSAKKLFGLKDSNVFEALGRVVNFNNKVDLVVRGIYEDLPDNSEFYFDSMISYEALADLQDYFQKTKWGTVDSNNFCYVLTDAKGKLAYENLFKSINDKYYSDRDEGYHVDYKLQPLSDVHLNEDFYNASESILDKQSMLILIGIVLILILTSCINFVNLSTALVIVRSKEIGIRKTIGSSRSLLIIQFLTETFLIVLMSLILGLGVAELLNYNLSNLIGKAVDLNIFNNIGLLPYLSILLLLIVLLSGLYPAFVLSGINPSAVLKTSLSSGNSKGINVRRGLVILQLIIAQLLIFGTLVLHFQMDYFYNKDLGFQKEGIFNVYLPRTGLADAEKLKEILSSEPTISSMSLNMSAPTGRANRTHSITYEPKEIDEEVNANLKVIDETYFDLFELTLLSGRNVYKNDTKKNVIINERLMGFMGFDDPNNVLGEKIKTGSGNEYTVIGVVKDFHVYSMESDIPYTMMMNMDNSKRNLSIKYNEHIDLQSLLVKVEDNWSNIYPNDLYSFSFYNEELKSSYARIQNINILVKIFSIITILISCLGLYGLITFVANQKTKEIGIRKVLGATLLNILNIFSKEIVYMTLGAFVLAAPIGYYLLSLFLADFHFRIDIGPLFFLSSLSLTLLVSVLSVGHKSYAASIQNPVLSLKDE